MGLSYEEMMDLNEEKLEKMGVTKVSNLDNANIKISSENISKRFLALSKYMINYK